MQTRFKVAKPVHSKSKFNRAGNDARFLRFRKGGIPTIKSPDPFKEGTLEK
jgi:hypothetical protein